MSPQARPLVSVVTPFYNTAAYLDEAIRSVRALRYPNFEYILADNCSTDDSLAIAQRHAREDARIRVVSATEFIAQFPNYNRALRSISPDSRYCKIVQADDWVDPDCLEEMVALAEANPRVGIVGCCFIAGNSLGGHGLGFDRSVFSGREACRARLLQGGTHFGSPTCLLFRADIARARETFYVPDQLNADTTACFEILRDADFALTPKILARLRRGNSSTSDRLLQLGSADFINYALIEMHGPHYLEPAEFEQRRRRARTEYLRALAHALLSRRGKAYWQFQSQCLARLGQQLPRAGIAAHTMDLLLDKLLNPRRTVESLLSRWAPR